jgi:hypothetical protein
VTILCWFCPVCATLTLLAKAQDGECCIEPRRDDCPLRASRKPVEGGRAAGQSGKAGTTGTGL